MIQIKGLGTHSNLLRNARWDLDFSTTDILTFVFEYLAYVSVRVYMCAFAGVGACACECAMVCETCLKRKSI